MHFSGDPFHPYVAPLFLRKMERFFLCDVSYIRLVKANSATGKYGEYFHREQRSETRAFPLFLVFRPSPPRNGEPLTKSAISGAILKRSIVKLIAAFRAIPRVRNMTSLVYPRYTSALSSPMAETLYRVSFSSKIGSRDLLGESRAILRTHLRSDLRYRFAINARERALMIFFLFFLRDTSKTRPLTSE